MVELPHSWSALCARAGLEPSRVTRALQTPDGPILGAPMALDEAAFLRDRLLQERGPLALWPALLPSPHELDALQEHLEQSAALAPPLSVMLHEAERLYQRLEAGASFADLIDGQEDEPQTPFARLSMLSDSSGPGTSHASAQGVAPTLPETTLEELPVAGLPWSPEPLAWYAHQLRLAQRGAASLAPEAALQGPRSQDDAQEQEEEEEAAQITLALLPVAHGWQAPALLRLGGYDDHPTPWEHVALLRHWQGRWGATLVALSPQVVELLSVRRPQGWADAFELAQLHLDYCPALHQPGQATLRERASALRERALWSFAWAS